jgi:hypothetical protein
MSGKESTPKDSKGSAKVDNVLDTAMEVTKDSRLGESKAVSSGEPTKTGQRLIVLSDGEPDDFAAVALMLQHAKSIGMESRDILIVATGRDPRDAQDILQAVADLYYRTVTVQQGSGSKNRPFVGHGTVFGATSRELKNTGGPAMVAFSNQGLFSIVSLAPLTDLNAQKEKIQWKNCTSLLVSGGPNAEGAPSFNLRSDADATKALLPYLTKTDTPVCFFGPLLYATSMLCNVSCNRDTAPKAMEALARADDRASEKPRRPNLAAYLCKWIKVWDDQLLKNSPEFAKKVPHLTQQFTPADLFAALCWVNGREYVTAFTSVDMECIPAANKEDADKGWFTIAMKRNRLSNFNRVEKIDMDCFENNLVSLFQA